MSISSCSAIVHVLHDGRDQAGVGADETAVTADQIAAHHLNAT